MSLNVTNSPWPKMAGYHLGDEDPQLVVAGTAGVLEQSLTHAGDDLPVASEVVDIACRDATAKVTFNVLDVLWLSAVDVAED